ncbi:MAG: response regulator, partial [Verrucomicrobiota bacterium]
MSLIALIEKDPMQQEMLSQLLQLHDPQLQVVNFSSGQSFIDASEHLKIDLLITELHLSDMDGLEIIQATQQEGYTIPVIVLASNASDFQHMARELGAIAAFEKPVDPDQLLAEVQRLLKLHQL